MTDEYDAYVARLVTEDELVLNVGSSQGVEVGDRYGIVDILTVDVPDPITGENLGSIPRYKATVKVTQVGELISLAAKEKTHNLLGVAAMISGASLSRTLSSGDTWPEGVAVADPAVRLRRKDQ